MKCKYCNQLLDNFQSAEDAKRFGCREHQNGGEWLWDVVGEQSIIVRNNGLIVAEEDDEFPALLMNSRFDGMYRYFYKLNDWLEVTHFKKIDWRKIREQD